jgi:hypothetical protein
VTVITSYVVRQAVVVEEEELLRLKKEEQEKKFSVQVLPAHASSSVLLMWFTSILLGRWGMVETVDHRGLLWTRTAT